MTDMRIRHETGNGGRAHARDRSEVFEIAVADDAPDASPEPRRSDATRDPAEHRSMAVRTAGALTAAAVLSAGLLVWALGVAVDTASTVTVAWIGLAAGALGSAVAALLSLSERIADGWELDDGSKLPESDRPARFNRRMWLLFAQRPLLGAFVGLVVALALVGDVGPFSVDDVGNLAFWVGVVGFFAKTVLERLRGMVNGLFGGR